MRAVEVIRHQLSLVVRVDDHFSGQPWPDELEVNLDTLEKSVPTSARNTRHADGTYRFVGLAAGPRQVTVVAPNGSAFTWSASTAVALPLTNPAIPLLIEAWPSPSARVAAGTLVIRGRLVTAAAGQEVQMQPVGVIPPRIRRTRCDAAGEFTFVVVGPVALTAAGEVLLAVTVPGRTLTSVQIIDFDANPTTPGTQFAVPPGREVRALFNLT